MYKLEWGGKYDILYRLLRIVKLSEHPPTVLNIASSIGKVREHLTKMTRYQELWFSENLSAILYRVGVVA